jgi:hypothetical protein
VACNAQILRKTIAQEDPPYGRGHERATPCGRMGSRHIPSPRPRRRRRPRPRRAPPPQRLTAFAARRLPLLLLRTRATQQGEIVEGSESEVRAGIFVVALTREVDAESGELCWRAAEVSFNAGTLFL